MDSNNTNTETLAVQDQPLKEPADLQTKTEISEEKLKAVMEFLKESTAPLCSQHKGKEVSIYCKTCERQICTSCVVAGDHSNHKLCEIDDIVPAKRQKLDEQMKQTRKDMLIKIQENVRRITNEKENVLKNNERVSSEILMRRDNFSERLEAWNQKQQSLVKSHRQKSLENLDDCLKESETCLAILEHFQRNPKCVDFIDGTKFVHVLEMFENTTGAQSKCVLESLAFTTKMGNADKMGKWFGHVTGIDLHDNFEPAKKIKFCDSQITLISPLNAKKAFLVTEEHLYLVDATQVKCTRADIKPLMTNVKYITPVTERGIYVQQTDSAVIKRVTTDGQIHHFTTFESHQFFESQYLRLSYIGTVLSVETAEKCDSGRRSVLVNEYNNNGEKLKKSKIILCQYKGIFTNSVHTAASIYALNTKVQVPTEMYEQGCVVNVNTATTYSGVIGSEPETTFHPRGLCTDQDDHLIVSDFWNHTVHQLTSGGKFKKFLMKESDGLMYPTAVGIDNINWLWVAQRDGHIHVVKYKH